MVHYNHIVNSWEYHLNKGLNGLSDNYESKGCCFGTMGYFSSSAELICASHSINTAGQRKDSLIKWNIQPFLCVWTTQSLQRQSDISIVHRALWTGLMVHFIDRVCCNLSIQLRQSAGTVLQGHLQPSASQQHESIYNLLQQCHESGHQWELK